MDYHTMISELEKELKPESPNEAPNSASVYKTFIHNTKIWHQIRFVSFMEDKLTTLDFDLNSIETYLNADSVDEAITSATCMNGYQAQAMTNQDNTVAKIKEIRTRMKATSSKAKKKKLEHEEWNIESIQGERLRILNGIACLKEMLGVHTFNEALNVISKSKLNKTNLRDFKFMSPDKFSNGHLTPCGTYMNSSLKKVANKPVATCTKNHKHKSNKNHKIKNNENEDMVVRQLQKLIDDSPHKSHKTHK